MPAGALPDQPTETRAGTTDNHQHQSVPIFFDSAWHTAQLSSVSSPKMVMLVLASASDSLAALDSFFGSSSGGSMGPAGQRGKGNEERDQEGCLLYIAPGAHHASLQWRRADVTDLAGGLCCCCWKLPAAPDTAQRLLLQVVMLHLVQLVVPAAGAHLVTLLLPAGSGSNACRIAAAAAGGAPAAV